MKKDSKQNKVIKLEGYWPYLVTVISERIARRTSKIVKEEAGLNLSQWRVMAAIGDVPGRTSVEVVTITPMDKGIVSRATKALLEQGLVRRKASQTDGRISYLFLTKKGQRVYETLVPSVEGILSRAEEALSEESQEELCSQLRRLMNVIPDFR